jgi:hypothetical protein
VGVGEDFSSMEEDGLDLLGTTGTGVLDPLNEELAERLAVGVGWNGGVRPSGSSWEEDIERFDKDFGVGKLNMSIFGGLTTLPH